MAYTQTSARDSEATGRWRVAAPRCAASHLWFQGGGYPADGNRHEIPFMSRIIADGRWYDACPERAYPPHGRFLRSVPRYSAAALPSSDPEIVAAFLSFRRHYMRRFRGKRSSHEGHFSEF